MVLRHNLPALLKPCMIQRREEKSEEVKAFLLKDRGNNRVVSHIQQRGPHF